MSHEGGVVRLIVRAFIELGRRLAKLAGFSLLAACGTRVGPAAAATPPHAMATTPAIDVFTPAVVSVSPGATIEWGFAVATAGMTETHVRYAEGRIPTR